MQTLSIYEFVVIVSIQVQFALVLLFTSRQILLVFEVYDCTGRRDSMLN